MSKDKKTPPGDKVKGFNLLKRAEIFFLTSAFTWSFISEINGDITIVVPGNNNAGTW